MAPQVSVVIPTHNYGPYVVEAIESVLEQTFQDIEVIVVDDGSVDDTRELLRPFGSKIRYIYQHNRGASAARNTGIRAAQGEYVALLDADDLWLPEKLALQVRCVNAHREAGMVYTDCLIFDAETQANIGTHRDHTPHPSGRILAQLVLGNVIPSATPLIKRSILLDVGLFDAARKGSEDWELWLKIAKVCDVAYVDRPLAKKRLHRNNMHREYESMHSRKLSRLNVLQKTFADPSLPKEIKRLQRQAYSRVYMYFGRTYYSLGEYELAWSDLIQSVKLYPRQLLSRRVTPFLFFILLGPWSASKVWSSVRKGWTSTIFSRK